MHTTHTITPDAQLEGFFGALSEGFNHAGPTRALNFSIARRQVRLSLAGVDLEHLLRPLAHLRSAAPKSPPDLEICAWQGPAGWTPPSPVWKQGQQGYQGEILGLGSGRYQVNYHDTSGLFSMIDHQARKVLYWIPRASDLPFWEIASPFRMIFHWWARALGGNVAHAAAVGKDGQGVLLVGKSGSGKSTAALACLYHGMQFVGDDYVLLMSEPAPTAYSLYSSAKMHTKFLKEALPAWKGMVATEIGPEGKSVFFLREMLPDTLRSSLELQAIVLPQVSNLERATLVPRPVSEGLLALAPSTIFQLPGTRREAMTFFSGFLRGMPVYAMRTGKDLASGPQALLELLNSLHARGMGVGVG